MIVYAKSLEQLFHKLNHLTKPKHQNLSNQAYSTQQQKRNHHTTCSKTQFLKKPTKKDQILNTKFKLTAQHSQQSNKNLHHSTHKSTQKLAEISRKVKTPPNKNQPADRLSKKQTKQLHQIKIYVHTNLF